MIYIRVRDGILGHWPIRVSEWIMTLPLFGMYAVLYFFPEMMSKTPTFRSMLDMLPQSIWTQIVLACGTARLVALTINGTFHQFRFSPHIRSLASICALGFWAHWTAAITYSVIYNNGTPSGIIAYGTFVVFEVRNLKLALVDASNETRQMLKRFWK